jgi:hypothetical protein
VVTAPFNAQRFVAIVAVAFLTLFAVLGCSTTPLQKRATGTSSGDGAGTTSSPSEVTPSRFDPDRAEGPWVLIENHDMESSRKTGGAVYVSRCEPFTIYNNDAVAYRVLNDKHGDSPGGDTFDVTVGPNSKTDLKIPSIGQIVIPLVCQPECGGVGLYLGYPERGELPSCG